MPSEHRYSPSGRSGAPPLARAEQFVWLTARVLEQRRFAHHFLGGGADAVETALDAYLNDDGGYGHALEPDLRGPSASPCTPRTRCASWTASAAAAGSAWSGCAAI